MSETVVAATRLRRLPGGPDADLVVEGGATLRGLDLSNMRWSHMRLHDGAPAINDVIPRPLRSRRGLLVFEDCVLDGLRVRHFEPWRARFVRCSFRDVKIGYVMAGGHFIDCIFSGEWNGNFHREAPTGDVDRVAQITGNDFTGVTGIAFYGGVPWQSNRFDIGGRHVLIRRHGPGWEAVKAAARHDRQLAIIVSSLEGHGPMGYAQDWQLEDRAFCLPETWQILLEHCVSPEDRR